MTQWIDERPDYCQICRRALDNFFIDGKVATGSWAIMCQHCHALVGVGLGTGKGQKYNRTTLEKVEG